MTPKFRIAIYPNSDGSRTYYPQVKPGFLWQDFNCADITSDFPMSVECNSLKEAEEAIKKYCLQYGIDDSNFNYEKD